jgi:radical SAM protein with 4Fe4S-binding SPASM domain
MTWDAFRRVVDAFGSSLDSLTLHNYGEPLLHPQLPDFIRYAKAADVPFVDLSTNGNTLPEGLAEELAISGLDAIRFSVDTADAEAYRRYRRGGELERVLVHVRRLAEARRSVQSETPHIEAQALLMCQNEPHAAEFERVLVGAGADSVRWKTFNVFMSGEALGDVGNQFLPHNSTYRRYAHRDPAPAAAPEQIELCRWPWDRLVVLADGTIVPCCHDYNGEYPLGQVAESGIPSMWETEARRDFMVRRILDPSSIPMCRRCSSAVPHLGLRKEAAMTPREDSAP